jgi:hypothetical protein
MARIMMVITDHGTIMMVITDHGTIMMVITDNGTYYDGDYRSCLVF